MGGDGQLPSPEGRTNLKVKEAILSILHALSPRSCLSGFGPAEHEVLEV